MVLHPIADGENRPVKDLFELEAPLFGAQVKVPPPSSKLPVVAEVILDSAHQLPRYSGGDPKTAHVTINGSSPFSAQRCPEARCDDRADMRFLEISLPVWMGG